MSRTGYKIEVYMDANPYSPTYGQERTERILDTTECVTQQPANYVHVYTYCEMNPNGSYTGNCVKVYEDVEPLSPTYGNQMEEVYTDGVLCPPDSADADWQQIDQYCEQIAYQPSGKLGNSGYMVTVYRDMGEYSPTYGQTRETREQDLVHCTPPSTEDVWVIISETCHLVDGLKDGTKDVVRVNTNEYSPNYNDGQSETINVEDLTMCPLDPESPVWTETSYVCVLDDGYRTGYVTVTEEDTNPQSASYGQTRTRTYQDEERCPYQEKPQPVSLKWRVINNRSASTDTITHITLHFNGNYDIDVLGNIAPVGGTLQGTIPLQASLTSTGLVCASIDLSPNTSLPLRFQFSQTPSPFVWDDTAGSAVLTVTLWDGDGTGPEWTEISYTCETVGGYRTGAAIITEEDMNPDSATYGQTRTRTVESDSRCPAQTDGDWVETSWSCQKNQGYNTGYVLSVQTDQNPNSSTYGTTRTRIIYDTERCPISTNPDWVVTSTRCEQAEEGESRNFKFQWWRRDDNNVTIYGQEDCGSDFDGLHLNTIKLIFGECMTSLPDDYANIICEHLMYVDLWRTITSIGDRAFYDCKALTTVIFRNTVPPVLGADVFYENYNNTDRVIANMTIYVPDASVSTYQTAWPEYASKIQPISNLT